MLNARDLMGIGKTLVIGAAICLGLSRPASAITVAPTDNATAIMNALFQAGGNGIDLSTVSVMVNGLTATDTNTSQTLYSTGTFTNGPGGTYGIGSGVVISTGHVGDYGDGSNSGASQSTNFATGERGQVLGGTTVGVPASTAQDALLAPITGQPTGTGVHQDVTQIDIAFGMLPGFDTVFFDVTFGSEEFAEFVGSSFIDGFGMFVNNVNVATVDANPINIDHPNMGTAAGTQLDGVLGSAVPANLGDPAIGSLVHTFSANVGDGTQDNTLTFIIGDTSDGIYDTTAYIAGIGGQDPADPDPALTTDPDQAIDFGNVRVGTTATEALMVSNSGEAMSILSGQLGGATGSGDFAPNTDQAFGPLGMGENDSRDYTYTPDAIGPDNGNVAVVSNAGNKDIGLLGNGVSPIFDTVQYGDGETIDFGTVDLSGPGLITLDLDILNNTPNPDLGSLTDLTILDFMITGPDAGLFSLSGFTMDSVLPASGMINPPLLELDLTFDPTAAGGPFSATLVFKTDQNAPFGEMGEQFTFLLTGEAFDPAGPGSGGPAGPGPQPGPGQGPGSGAVPEPLTAWLGVLGLAALASQVQRRRHAG